ncbi:hypothetical protein [Aeromonas schubertii]
MTDAIQINTERLAQKLEELRQERTEAFTTEIIDRYMGGFHSNKEVPASDSWNAQFGKYLKAHESELNIRELAAKQKVSTNGSTTTSSLWSLHG